MVPCSNRIDEKTCENTWIDEQFQIPWVKINRKQFEFCHCLFLWIRKTKKPKWNCCMFESCVSQKPIREQIQLLHLHRGPDPWSQSWTDHWQHKDDTQGSRIEWMTLPCKMTTQTQGEHKKLWEYVTGIFLIAPSMRRLKRKKINFLEAEARTIGFLSNLACYYDIVCNLTRYNAGFALLKQ